MDVDATVVEVHSEKESAAAHFKGGYGYNPLLVWLDNTARRSRGCCARVTSARTPPPTTSPSWTLRWTESPTPPPRQPDPGAREWDRLLPAEAGLLRALREQQGLDVRFSVGFTMTEQVQAAILAPTRGGVDCGC